MTRLLCVRIDADGTITDGTCEVETAEVRGDGRHRRTLVAARDFRDLDGHELPLAPGSTFEIPLNLHDGELSP